MGLGKLIGEGRTAEIYGIDDNRIIKLFKKGYKKKYIKYEYRVNNILSAYDLPITKSYKIVKRKNRIGIIYERIYGNTMLQNIFDDTSNIKTYAQNLAKLHYEIHKITSDKTLHDFKKSLIRNIKKVDLLDSSTKRKIISYTNSLPDGNNLCHGDFHPENILIDNDEYYVIDWMTAKKGNYLCDVARTMIILKYSVIEDAVPLDEMKQYNEWRLKLLNYYADFYTSISGTNIKDIEEWELPLAATRLNESVPKQEKELLIDYINNKIKK